MGILDTNLVSELVQARVTVMWKSSKSYFRWPTLAEWEPQDSGLRTCFQFHLGSRKLRCCDCKMWKKSLQNYTPNTHKIELSSLKALSEKSIEFNQSLSNVHPDSWDFIFSRWLPPLPFLFFCPFRDASINWQLVWITAILDWADTSRC